MTDSNDFEEHVYDRIADILLVLSDVTSTLFSSRLPEIPDEDPFSALFKGINETVDSLSEAHARSALYQKELEEKLATIEQQRAAIKELSTPVIEVSEGVLCLPVVGVMDTVRSAEMTETLLRSVVEKNARCAVIDVTGIEVMDTATADHFLRMAKAVRLLGAECVLTGVRPAIAQTIVHMGVDLRELRTHRSLRDALSRWVASPSAASRRAGGDAAQKAPRGTTGT